MLKNVQKWMEKWVPNFIKNEIAGLRHFYHGMHFSIFFCQIFAWRFGGPWVSLGRLLGFLRVSWEVSGPKNTKNNTDF